MIQCHTIAGQLHARNSCWRTGDLSDDNPLGESVEAGVCSVDP